MTKANEQDRNAELRTANSCIVFGAGLGAVGTGTALLAGATCPLCVAFAPVLIGYGAWRRFAANHERGVHSKGKEEEDSKIHI